MAFNDEVDQIYLRQERTVRRIGRAAGVGGDWSPAADFGIFTIAGGPIRITGMFGHVTAVFAGANAIPLITYGAANALCVVAVAAAFALNSLLVWDGSLTAVSGVLRETVALAHSQVTDSVGTPATAESWVGTILCLPGQINIVNVGGAADATGVVDWYLSYIPLTQAASVIAIP